MENPAPENFQTFVEPTVSPPTPQPTSSTPQKINLKIALLAIGLLLVVSVGSYYVGKMRAQSIPSEELIFPMPSSSDDGVMCTMDAMICPDGSTVGRVGPDCEFAACPNAGSSVESTTLKVFKSPNYPYQIYYPEDFVYEKRDAGKGEYEGYIENSHFERTEEGVSGMTAFYVYITQPIAGSPYEPNLDTIFDYPPTGTYVLDTEEVKYAELPQGYGDGGMSTNPPPLLALQFARNGAFYKIVFVGISSINDPLAQQILPSFSFTD